MKLGAAAWTPLCAPPSFRFCLNVAAVLMSTGHLAGQPHEAEVRCRDPLSWSFVMGYLKGNETGGIGLALRQHCCSPELAGLLQFFISDQ